MDVFLFEFIPQQDKSSMNGSILLYDPDMGPQGRYHALSYTEEEFYLGLLMSY